mmetsp:Transcript_9057/g.18556  ORF Transcript_9057/g.18556 Transcript_9057/m.18556 type:complete len:244 (-) Transcript_9057:393-1124(-)
MTHRVISQLIMVMFETSSSDLQKFRRNSRRYFWRPGNFWDAGYSRIADDTTLNPEHALSGLSYLRSFLRTSGLRMFSSLLVLMLPSSSTPMSGSVWLSMTHCSVSTRKRNLSDRFLSAVKVGGASMPPSTYLTTPAATTSGTSQSQYICRAFCTRWAFCRAFQHWELSWMTQWSILRHCTTLSPALRPRMAASVAQFRTRLTGAEGLDGSDRCMTSASATPSRDRLRHSTSLESSPSLITWTM